MMGTGGLPGIKASCAQKSCQAFPVFIKNGENFCKDGFRYKMDLEREKRHVQSSSLVVYQAYISPLPIYIHFILLGNYFVLEGVKAACH